MKRFIIYVICLIIMLMPLFSMEVNAEEYVPIDTRNPDEPAYSTEEGTENAKNMEIQSNSWENWPEGPETYGEAGIVMDAQSGTVLYAKNIDGYAYPASITKVLTTLVALENGTLDDIVVVNSDSLSCLEGGYASIGLKEGEEITLEDALYAVLLASANEASHAVASSVGDSYEWFIQEMNNRAKELGAVNSNFVNTNGVHDDEHYSTAKDMALITRELINNYPEFEQISQTLQYTIEETNLTDETRTFQQTHLMFYEASQYFDARVVAGKTGYTYPAKNTLITCTDNQDLRLIVVVMKTHGKNVYNDTQKLINYGYDNFEKISVAEYEKSEEIVSIPGDSYLVVPKGVTFEELEMTLTKSKKDGVAVASYTYNGQNVGSVEVGVLVEEEIMDEPENPKSIKEIGMQIIKVIVILFIICALGFSGLLIAALIYREKRRKERRRRREAKRRRYLQELERKKQEEAALKMGNLSILDKSDLE